MELIIETIFGISYRADEKVVTVSPKITENLKNECLELRHICLSKGVFLDVGIDHGIVSYRVSSDSIKVNVAEFV